MPALDETYVAAVELQYVASDVAKEMRPSDDVELYFLDLLGGADAGDVLRRLSEA